MTSVDEGGRAIRYAALGDSYTIGEGVPENARWPNRVVRRLQDEQIPVDLVANEAVTGWTTADLIEHGLPVFERSAPDFGTLLIGVNDWVQGVSLAIFEERLALLLNRMQAVLPNPGRIVMVTIPDFSVTPAGGQYARGRDISAGLATFNAAIVAAARSRALPVVDIFPLSEALIGRAFVAEDELHPSGLAYERWADVIAPVALEALLQTGGERQSP